MSSGFFAQLTPLQAVSVAKRWRGHDDDQDDDNEDDNGEVPNPPILNWPATPTPNGHFGPFPRPDNGNSGDTRSFQGNGHDGRGHGAPSSSALDRGELELRADGKAKREKNPPEHLPALPACFFLHDLLAQRA